MSPAARKWKKIEACRRALFHLLVRNFVGISYYSSQLNRYMATTKDVSATGSATMKIVKQIEMQQEDRRTSTLLRVLNGRLHV